MTQVEQQFIIWASLALLSVIAFIGGLGVKALIKMSRDLNDIKVMVSVQATKHDSLEKRVEILEEEL